MFVLLVLVAVVILCAQSAAAKYTTWEQLFGATNINAAGGNGGLTVGISARGELTALHWPNPSYYDHLNYLTVNTDDVRELPYFGALPSMGAFFGLVVQQGDDVFVTWLRDKPWTVQQHYLNPRCDVIVTDYAHAELGLVVHTEVFVATTDDALLWRIELSEQSRADIVVRQVLFYENLSPSMVKTPYIPLDGWAFDIFADYAALYDQTSSALVHLRPQDLPYGELTPLMRNETLSLSQVQQFVDGTVAGWPAGAYLGVTLLDQDFSFQIGEDDAANCEVVETILQNADWDAYGLPDLLGLLPICPADPRRYIASWLNWQYRPPSAWTDAADGVLSGSPAAGVQADGALAFDLVDNGATVVIAAAETLSALRENFARVRERSYDDHRNDNLAYWQAWTAGAIMPDTDDERIRNFALRALISIKTAQDRLSGNIVASIATQPPYTYDWPRDSAFINYVLDMAGFTQAVTLHNRTYVNYQRKQPLPFDMAPAGSYQMNYDAAGRPGGPIYFEIDNTGLITWSYVNHYYWLQAKQDPEATAYLQTVYPAIALAADGLTECKDEETGLQCLAFEDDNFEQTQTIHGASAVYAGLQAAMQAGRIVGEDEDKVQSWETRAEELRAAAIEHFWNEEEGRFIGSYKGEIWSIFPAGMLEPGDPMANSQVDYLLSWAREEMSGDKGFLRYTALAFVSLGWYYRQTGDEEGLAGLREMISEFLHWIPTEDTLHLGEVAVLYDFDNDGFYETAVNEVCLPHVWNQALNYLAAVLAYGGTPLTDDDDDTGDNDDDDTNDEYDDTDHGDADDDDDNGCGC